MHPSLFSRCRAVKIGAAPWLQIGARYREITSRRSTDHGGQTNNEQLTRKMTNEGIRWQMDFPIPSKKKLFERIGKSNADFSETFMVDLQVGVEQNRI